MNGGMFTADLGTRTGWSLLTQDGSFSCGVLDLGVKRGNTNGTRLMRLRAFVKEKLESGRVTLIVYEKTLTRHKSSHQANLSAQMVGVLEEEASVYGVEVMAVPNNTLKKHATGDGRSKKPRMIRAAWERWSKDRKKWVMVSPGKEYTKVGKDVDEQLVADLKVATVRGKVPDDNQVDAVWLANYAVTELNMKPRAQRPARGPGSCDERRGTELNIKEFTGEPVPCAACGEPVTKTAFYCLWAHAPQDPEKWTYKHPACLLRPVEKQTVKKKNKKRTKSIRTRGPDGSLDSWETVEQLELFK